MATAGALEDQELMSEGKNLSLQRCSSLKGLASRRKQRENDCEHVAEKLQRRLPKFNQFNQNGVFGRDRTPFTAPFIYETLCSILSTMAGCGGLTSRDTVISACHPRSISLA
ncbi:MAG: hypothetical protein DMG40_02875 [Acidobacteria bacterium]|nr:MAG: hypothetical protein DMG40_02875 [Acidobacteriota bacterium]